MKQVLQLAFSTAVILGGGALFTGCKPMPPKSKAADAKAPAGAEEKQNAEQADASNPGETGDALERLAARLEREADEDGEMIDDEGSEGSGKGRRHAPSIDNLRCPEGTELLGNPPPKGNSQYCGKRSTLGGGIKHGPFVKWDDNGSKRYEANFDNDVLDGRSTTYFPSGDVAERQDYLKGIKSGRWEKWNRDGIKIAEGFYSNGKKSGRFRYWSRHGEPVSEGNFHDEVKSGLWIFYDRDGLVRSKFTFRNGRKDGKAQMFYANGRVASTGSFKENKPDGLWIYYNEEGRQTAQGSFTRGRKTGQWTEYDQSGRIQSVRNFAGGRVDKKGRPVPATAPNQSGFVSM